MANYPDFNDLPFNERPDLSPSLIHLTKNTNREDSYSAFDNLVNILQNGEIWGSDTKNGFIKGNKKATCFMDIPMQSLKYVINSENSNPDNPRYEPYGILVAKEFAYRKGCRPVLYLSDEETKKLNIPRQELWRVVRFEVKDGKWLSWLHEREWRCEGSFVVPKNVIVLVRTTYEIAKLQRLIANNPTDFKVKPRSILPLDIVCQGLRYL